MNKLVITAALLVAIAGTVLGQTFNIVDYGALADAKTLNTKAIQKAIDACTENGGGTVYVPAGTFISGTILLKSNVNLYLETGASLKGSPNLNDYLPYKSVDFDTSHYGIVYAHGAKNVSITGMGSIDGNEEAFFNWQKAKKIEWGGTQYTRQKENFRKVEAGIGDGPVEPLLRPRQMVIFSECTNVLVQNITLTKSAFWTLHFADCDGVIAQGVKIWNSLETPNSDGLDITSCKNVIVTGCDIRAGDDAIAITGYGYHYELPGYVNTRHKSGNINIANCNLQSRSSGIRIGFEDQNTVSNINISNINITNSNRGIGIFVRDSGSIENINISQVYIETRLHTGDWWGNGEPIHISAIRSKPNIKIGQIKNVVFRDITCQSENGILLYGTAESPLENIRFENLKLRMVNSPLNHLAGGNIDLRGCLDPSQALFARNIPAFLGRYVNQLYINNFELSWEPIPFDYFTTAIEVEQFSGLRLDNFSGTNAPTCKIAQTVVLKNGEKVNIGLNPKLIKKENVKP